MPRNESGTQGDLNFEVHFETSRKGGLYSHEFVAVDKVFGRRLDRDGS